MWATEGLNKAVKRQQPKEAFFALQNLLVSTANIAKALWWQGGRMAEDRKPLRDSIGVSDNSPLRCLDMRNNFEHFDERLDRWHARARHVYVDSYIGDPNLMGCFDKEDVFRSYDPAKKALMFWGQEFNVQDITDEVSRILARVTTELQRCADRPELVRDRYFNP